LMSHDLIVHESDRESSLSSKVFLHWSWWHDSAFGCNSDTE
jgi:hypothetical protein